MLHYFILFDSIILFDIVYLRDPEKTGKAKKRKLEKLVNWGMEEDGDSGEQVEETLRVTDWFVRKQITLATKDWLLTPISTKPWTRNLRQATLNIQRMTPCQTA